MEYGEDWRHACARELEEETGLATDPERVRVQQVESAPDGTLLVFGLCAPADPGKVDTLGPRPEVQDLLVIEGPSPMAFPLHEKVVRDFFEGGTGRG
jgi:ADP-ribose pyrophosphatase YjhB (NUDIX family)